MELLAACWLVAWLVVEAPQAIADAYVARRAAKAGAWDFLNTELARRSQRDAARAARRQQWADRIFNRRQAGTGGEPKRAGLGTLAGDVYHGMCEDALTRRATRRVARPPHSTHRPTLRRKAVDLLKNKVRTQRDERGDRRPLPDDELAPTSAGDRMPCPRCGQTMTRGPSGWTHPSGVAGCPTTTARPAAPVPTPGRGSIPEVAGRPAPPPAGTSMPTRRPASRPPNTAQPFPTSPATASPQGVPDSDAMARDFELAHLAEQSAKENTMTTPTIGDVQTNEAARQAFTDMKAAAAQLAEAAQQAEDARRRIAANAQAAADGMAGVRFDPGAVAAVGDVNDTVHDGTLAKWSEVSDTIMSACDTGLRELEQYRDAEDLVASRNVAGSTLEPSAS